MNIYHLRRTYRAPWIYDYREFVIVAATDAEALRMVKERCANDTTFSCTEIGKAHQAHPEVLMSDEDEEN